MTTELARAKPKTMRDMDLFETNSHPFIIRIWLEETVDEAGQATWRGHITHVPSDKRRYLNDLDDIKIFIAPYLEAMGVKLQKVNG